MSSAQKISPRAFRYIVVPSVLFALTLVMIVGLWTTMVTQNPIWNDILFFMGLAGSLYGLAVGLIFTNKDKPLFSKRVSWLYIVVVGISLGLIGSLIPVDLFFLVNILYVLNIIGATLIFPISRVRILILIAFVVHLHGELETYSLGNLINWIHIFSLPLLAFVVGETVQRFQSTIAYSLNRVSIVNAISRKLSSSLNEKDVHTWLKEAIQDAFDADTYYLALVDGDNLDLGLFYDDGEYFHAVQIPIEGTLGGWAILHNQTLFLNDLRTEPKLEGVKTRLVGKEKASLSWLGVPFKEQYVTGMTGIASYRPLAFTKEDVELLESLTQQAALALNNARQHKLVTLQAQLDSLTKVFNHGYFLERLKEDLVLAREDSAPLCLIMLDVDFFKQYNDTYGHLVGDEVLMLMVKTIKRFIKERDSIGRWGGEEFVICLPKTDLAQAQVVAKRIQKTFEKMHISVLDQKDIPVPTVSQGIAEFPKEADETFNLIDLADRRLYVAKKRGRNQIEPNPDSE